MTSLITLVNSNQVKPPIAPIAFDYLHGPLVDAGFSVDVLDLCFADDPATAIRHYCQEKRPNFWGVTLRNTDDVYMGSGYSFLAGVRDMIAALRRYRDVPIVLGGVGFSVMPKQLLRYLGADYGIISEGEVALPALLRRLRANADVADIPGLVYRRAGEIHVNRHAKGAYTAVPQTPAHRRTLVDNARYFRQGGQLGLETKRGCNRRCIYCVEPLAKGQQVRIRDPALIVDEIESLLEQGFNVFHINDSEFNLSISHPLALCAEIRKRRLQNKIEWYAYGMPAPFPDHLAAAMRSAGCVGMNFGVDTASEKMLRILRRTFEPHDIRNAIATVKRHGLQHIIELLFGAPGETPETVRETIDFIKDADPEYVSVTVGLRIFPDTELERMVRAEGLTPDNPALKGAIEDNDDLLLPVFYTSPALGPDPFALVGSFIDGDPRFLDPNAPEFNYNANDVLVNAIADGERGAYWAILSRLRNRYRDGCGAADRQALAAGS